MAPRLLCWWFALHAAFANPTAAQDPAAPILGIWRGQAVTGAERADLAFEITQEKDGVALFVTLPPLKAWRMPVAYLQQTTGGVWTIADWKITMRREGGHLVGELGNSRVTFSLDRAETLPVQPAPAASADWPAGSAPSWTFDTGAPLWASPAVADGVVYIGDSGGRVHAIDAVTGMKRWTVDAGAPIYGDVTIAGDAVFVFDDGGVLRKLARRDGRVIWKVELGPDTEPRILPSATAFDYDYKAPAPLVDQGIVYIPSSRGVVHAIDAGTGAVRWRQPLGARVRASVVATSSRLFVGALDHHVYSLDRTTGAVVWRHDMLDAVTSAVSLSSDLVIAGSRSSWLNALKQSDGTPAWSRFNWFSWVESTGAVVDNTLYVGSSDLREVRALSARTGAALWATDVLGFSWGTPVVAGDTVYAGVAGARQYVTPHDGGLIALDRRTGRIKWGRHAALAAGAFISGYPGSVAVSGRRLFAANINGVLESYVIPKE